jgi:hypothetical protein
VPRYYFTLLAGTIVDDQRGKDFSNAEAAKRYAEEMLRGMSTTKHRVRVVVTDADGNVVCECEAAGD